MKTLFKIVISLSNNKLPKRYFEGSKNRIDRIRNALRGRLIKVMISKGYMVKGQKFGDVELTNRQQVSALIRVFKSVIREYVITDLDKINVENILQGQNYKNSLRYSNFYEYHEVDLEKYATLKPITTEIINEVVELVIKQQIDYFTETLTKKVRG